MISAYRVNPGHHKVGEFSVYKQLYNLMLKHEKASIDPRQQTIIDLETFIQAKLDNHEEIILSIDANETYDETKPSQPHSIRSLSENLGLINLSSNHQNQYETHKGGRHIDFCLVTLNIVPAIHAFGFIL